MAKRLVVTAVVKNAAGSVEQVFRKLARLRNAVDDVAFVVYENNSTDGTKAVLSSLERKIPRFHLISEDLSQRELESISLARHKNGSPCRIEHIARARKIAQRRILQDFGDWDQVLVVDADVGMFSLRSIERNVQRLTEHNYDGIFANGLTKWLRYRDAFAFRSERHPFGPEFLGDYWWGKTILQIQKRHRTSSLIPVYSAFGGAGLYSMDAFRAGSYSAIADESFMRLQRTLDVSRASSDELARASREAQPNTNYSLAIVCEHVPFNYSLIGAGFGRLAMDPTWRLLFWD